jgi:hypothetical protein
MKNEAIDINALSDKALLALESAMSKMTAKRTPSTIRRRRPRKAYEQLTPHPSDVLDAIKFERQQGNKNAVSDGYDRARKRMIEQRMDTEQSFRRLYKNIAAGRIPGNMRLARSEVLD